MIPIAPGTIQRWLEIRKGELWWSDEGAALFNGIAKPTPIVPTSRSNRNYILLPGGFLIPESRARIVAAFGRWTVK